MQTYAPGQAMPIVDVPTGACILFRSFNDSRVGFIVEFDEGERFLLDPQARTQAGEGRPAIYDIQRHLTAESCLCFPDARLVPSYKPEHIGKGHHANGAVSRALYLDGASFILQAAREYNVATFDLATGKYSNFYTSRAHFTTNWAIMVPDVNGRFQELAAFRA